MRYKAVLFDLDGTLLDTLEDMGDAMNQVLAKNGFPTHPLDTYRYFIGDGATALVTRALPEEKRNDDCIRACLETFGEEYGRNWKVKTKAYEGVAEMLNELAARRLKMAVLSNKPDGFAKRDVSELLPNWTFDIVFGKRKGVPLKPHPAGALEVAKCLNVSPGHFLYLGDSAVDMKTAVAAGMVPVGVLWGFRPEQELREGGAHVCIKRPQEILNLLE